MKKVLSSLDDQKKTILGKLEGLRSKRKMPVKEVAALMGKSPSYYSVALNRGSALTVESLAKIAAAFGMALGECAEEAQHLWLKFQKFPAPLPGWNLANLANDGIVLLRKHREQKRVPIIV